MVTLPRIDSVLMAVSVDEDGSEGVCAILLNGMWTPLLAADDERLPFVREQAELIARSQHRLVRIVRLSVREVVEQFDGRM